MYQGTKFQSIWRTLVFGTKFTKKRGVLGQTQPENNLL